MCRTSFALCIIVTFLSLSCTSTTTNVQQLNSPLPKHITGFSTVFSPLEETFNFDEKVKPYIDSICNELNYHLQELSPPSVGNNYYKIVLQKDNKNIILLCNSVYPYFCFTKSFEYSYTVLEFTDNIEIETILKKNPDFVICTSEYLNSEVTKVHLKKLAQVERDQISYWKTKRIGEIIFNYYD